MICPLIIPLVMTNTNILGKCNKEIFIKEMVICGNVQSLDMMQTI